MPKFREITGQFVGYIPDGIDPDVVPDRAPMNGRVTFTPVFTGGVIAFPELSPPEFARPEPISALIVDGFVRVAVGVDDGVTLQPLTLMVTVDDEATQTWSWRADFSDIAFGPDGNSVAIPAWSFRVPDGVGPVDLTELVPLKTSVTVDVTKGPRGAGLQTITAQNGELVFEYTDGEQATIPVPEAVQGPEGPQGPAGADGAEGPQGEKGDPGEIPDLLVGNITDATPTGKNLMLAATEGAARSALGLAAGATAINGALSELENGVSNNPRVWTPANIANYVSGKISDRPTSAEVETGMDSIAEPGGDMSQHLDRVSPIMMIPARPDGELWPNGLGWNEEDGHIYVAYHGAVSGYTYAMRMCRYDLTGNLVDFKDSDGVGGDIAANTACPHFRNSGGDLCFITNHGPAGKIRRIYNYTKDKYSEEYASIPGGYVGDRDGKYYVTSDHDNALTGMSRAYYYTWESVKNLSPVLSHAVILDTPHVTKTQGFTSINGNLMMLTGAYGTSCGMVTWNAAGSNTGSVEWGLSSMRSALNAAFPSAGIPESYNCEAEGVTRFRGASILGYVARGTSQSADEAKFFVLRSQDPRGRRVESLPSRYSADSGWVEIPVSDTGSFRLNNVSVPFVYRRSGNVVELRGEFYTLSADWPDKVFAVLPAYGFVRPSANVNRPVISNGSTGANVIIRPNGNLQFNRFTGTPAAGQWLALSAVYIAG